MDSDRIDLDNLIANLDQAIIACEHHDSPENISAARASFETAVRTAIGAPTAPRQISTLLQVAIDGSKKRREAGILTLRALAVNQLLPLDDDPHLGRNAVKLIELSCPDLWSQMKLKEKGQTFEKLEVLRGFHSTVLQSLEVLRNLPRTLTEIDHLKGEIQKAIRKDSTVAYLAPFAWATHRYKIIHVLDQISQLVACKDSTYKSIFDQLEQSCSELGQSSARTFVERDYIQPFKASVLGAMQALRDGASAHFACRIEPRRKSPHLAEKKYQLHRIDEFITITVPMINVGPGMATDLYAEIGCAANGPIIPDVEEIRLGDIPPGEFAISFKAMVCDPVKSVDMVLQVTWGQLFGESQSVALDLRLEAQDSEVNWAELEKLDPFSLEVADSTQFVGRTAKVHAIGNRLLKEQMSSTYVTGQKRVGKTSLAKAVMRYVDAQSNASKTFKTLYLEWGEYSTDDARSTVLALGEQINWFFQQYLPPEVKLPPPQFAGTLAPLNTTARALETHAPALRFVIVLDEFDEIHPEMYRYGPLAEVFFANLRTLAARKNLAFLLVGGEKMPFIIGAQGDQLNKFVREPLDYFSRADEWSDFVELVTGPTRDSLNWEDAALNELFTLTHGHPYYTKLLCAKVFSNAVNQRDTEVIASDVRRALRGRISELDTNSFAHFWKDGINSEREAAEIIELKRLRTLVAFGRASRLGPATKDTMMAEIPSTTMEPTEAIPVIEDFCRRDILIDQDGGYAIQVPVFDRWLKDVGVSKLISSTLADDLEVAQRAASDAAYVRAAEIEALVKPWPLYRGNQITGETVRAWLEQVSDAQDQRLLFTILQKMRFVTPAQIGEALKSAHSRIIARIAPPMTRESKVEKRRDLVITYLDGIGKSGATYARTYAKENGVLMERVLERGRMQKRLTAEDAPNAVVLVDDIAGTGKTLADLLKAFLDESAASLEAGAITLAVVLLFATEDARDRIEAMLKKYSGVKSLIHVHEVIGEELMAFGGEGRGIWSSEDVRDRAKALCVRLGTGLYREPLGFGSQALMMAFPDTCPNNSLPIIFASKSGSNGWNALLGRPTS